MSAVFERSAESGAKFSQKALLNIFTITYIFPCVYSVDVFFFCMLYSRENSH